MDKKRLTGVAIAIIGWLNVIFFGGISLFLYILIFLASFVSFGMKAAVAYGQSAIIFRAIMIYGIVISAAFIITGLGVLKLKEIARTQTIYLAIVMVLADILFSVINFSAAAFLISLIYPAILITFFSLSNVKEQFKQQQPN